MLSRLLGSPLSHPVFRRIGGGSFLGPSVALGALLVSFVTSMATFSSKSWSEVALWAAANCVSFGIVFIPIAALWASRRTGRLVRLRIGAVLTISAGIGFTKTTSVSMAFALFTGGSVDVQDLMLRGVAGAILGIVLLPSLTLAVDSLGELRALRRIVNRQELLNSIGDELNEPQSLLRDLDSELDGLIAHIRSGQTSLVAQDEILALRSLVTNHVRPASKAFWQASQIQLERLTWQSLLRIAASRDIWIPVVVLPLVSGFALGAIQAGGNAAALAHALLLIPVLTLVLLTMNRLEKFQLNKPGAWFTVTMVIAGPVAWFVTGAVTDQELWQNLGWLIGYTFWLTLGSLGASLGRLILQERRDLLTQLAELKLNLSHVKPAEILESRKRANQLHGEVQSRLVANVFLAESSESLARSTLIEQLIQIQRLIREEVPEHKDFAAEFRLLSQTWVGFVNIFTLRQLPDLDAKLGSRAIAVIEEGVQNAFRHGLADQCRLELEFDSSNLKITLVDNGVGVRTQDSGVGSALFASEDPAWSISNAVGGGAVLTVTLANQVKTP